MSQLDLFDTLLQAKANLEANLDKGGACPCCGQHAQRYRRKLNSGMARALVEIWLRQKNTRRWVRVEVLVAALRVSPELGKLRWWGLVETKENDDAKKRTSGSWRLTEKGQAFLRDLVKVPSHAVVFNNQLERLEGKEIGIREALGSKFDYAELMAGGRGAA